MKEVTPIRPLGKRVLIKPQEKTEVVRGGIVLPTDSINPPFFIGTVVKVSPEVTLVKEGDVVAHKKYGMEIIPTEKGDLYLVEETSLIAIYE